MGWHWADLPNVNQIFGGFRARQHWLRKLKVSFERWHSFPSCLCAIPVPLALLETLPCCVGHLADKATAVG